MHSKVRIDYSKLDDCVLSVIQTDLQSTDPRLIVVECAAIVSAGGLNRPRQHWNCIDV